MVVEAFTLEALLAGVAGGVLGAAIGGLPALSLAGFVIVVGEAANALLRAVGAQTLANPSGLSGVGITETIGLGPALGPHVAFAGGAAAAAYAGRHGALDDAFPYHPAKDVRTPLGSSPDVLLAGGLFGLLGVLLARVAAGWSLPVDPVAFAVVLSGVGHRVAFGYPLLGRVEGDLLDLSPFEHGERRGGIGAADPAESSGRFAVEPWQPHHYAWVGVTILGAAVGAVAGYVGLATGSAFLAFGLAAASLVFLALGVDRFPVTHHMALPASIAALALAGQPAWLGVLAGGVFGVLGGLFGEFGERVLYAHADTHLDPSFLSILLTSVVLAGLATVGVLDPAAIPYPVP